MDRILLSNRRRAGRLAVALLLATWLAASAQPAQARPRKRSAASAHAHRKVSLLRQSAAQADLHLVPERRGDLLEVLALREMHCPACLASLQAERDYEPGLEVHLDWNRLTTVTLGDTVLRLTNVQPFSFLVRKQF